MTDNNNINNISEEPDEMVVDYFTGDRRPIGEMVQCFRTTAGEHYARMRHNWLRMNPNEDPSNCPWHIAQQVWVSADTDWTYCDDCGELVDSEYVSLRRDNAVCEGCEHNYECCCDCDEWFNTHDYDYCPDCGSDDSSSLVHDYSYRPSPVFYLRDKDRSFEAYREPANTAVTGFELEMECERGNYEDCAEYATMKYQTAYLKHDGSLNHGFEMVTHPMSLDYINNEFDFDGLRRLADMGMRSARTSTCGLHVHINKGFFRQAPSASYRFMNLFYANAEQWRRLAGRSHSGYAQWDIGEESRLLHYTKGIRDNDMYMVNRDRYVAVNLQPSKTIELRFFKGTLRPLTLQARLQAVHAVAEFAMSTRYKVKVRDASSWDAFRDFTTANDNKYNAFNNYATEKGV